MKFVALLLLVFSLGGMYGQSADTTTVLDVNILDETVVYDRQTGLANRTPYNVTNVSLRGIELKSHPNGVMGHLRDQQGVYGAEMGQGIVKPFVRGLGFSRVVTVFQGNKLENHQWGADHGLGVNDLGVSAAKIIKGPASILYGSGAIGGVLLLEDDERFLNKQQWSGSAGVTYNSVSGGFRPYLSVGRSFANGLFVGAEAAVENHADYKDGDGRVIGNSRFNSETMRVHTGYQKEGFRAKLSYTYLNQNLGIIEDDEMEESLATERYDRTMQLPFQHVKDHLISYNQFAQLGSDWEWHLHLSHHINDRREIEDDFDDIDLGLFQQHTFYNNRFRWQANEQVSHTFGWMGSFVEMRNMEEAEEVLIPNAAIWENGLYYLGAFEPSSRWLMEYGLRYDNRMVNADATAPHILDYGFVLPGAPSDGRASTAFNGFTGSGGVTYLITEKQQFKINLATGFRAPDLAELYSNGPHPGTNRFEIGNADFNREQSYQADVSYQYDNGRFRFMLSPFINLVDNYIYFSWNGSVRSQDGLQEWTFQQTNALLYGGEIQLEYQLLPSLSARANGSIVRGVFDDLGGDPLTFIPPDNYNVRLNYIPWKNSSAFVHLRYVADHTRPGPGERETDGFLLLNAGASHAFAVGENTLSVGLTVFNAFNQTFVDHMSILRAFDIPSPGRNLMVNVQYAF